MSRKFAQEGFSGSLANSTIKSMIVCCLAVLETDHAAQYFLNLHHRGVAHTLILGATGAGKAFLKKYVRKLGLTRQMDLPLSA